MDARADRQRTTTATRKVLGLFVAAWVSLALQPCALATEAEHSCPHCPTESEAAPESAHHRHHSGEAAKAADCSSMQADCCEFDEGIVSVRLDPPNPDEQVLALPPTIPGAGVWPTLVQDFGNATGPPRPPAGRVPLHVLNCVYLK